MEYKIHVLTYFYKRRETESCSPREISRAKAMHTSISGRPTDTNLMTLSRGSSSSRWLIRFIPGPSCSRASDSMALAAAWAMDILNTYPVIRKRLNFFLQSQVGKEDIVCSQCCEYKPDSRPLSHVTACLSHIFCIILHNMLYNKAEYL